MVQNIHKLTQAGEDLEIVDLNMFQLFVRVINVWTEKEGFDIFAQYSKQLYFVVNECFGMSN